MPTAPARPAPEAGTPLAVEAEDLAKSYGDKVAVADVDLEIREGEIVGFVGPSGSGKTTTTRMLTGIERPDRGAVRVLGGDPSRFSAQERSALGYMPQLSVLFPNLSLRENLSFVASIYGLRLRRRKVLRRALELVELYDDRRTRLRDASGGMQRRLALAAALLHEPPLLFLDEPTAGIDPVLRRHFWDHFTELRDAGRTLFITTQYVTEASYCDRVAVLAEGRVVTIDTPDGLRRQAFGGELLDVETAQPLPGTVLDELLRIDGVDDVRASERGRRHHRLVVGDATTLGPLVRHHLDSSGAEVIAVQPHLPSFDDVFVTLVQHEDGGPPDDDGGTARAGAAPAGDGGR
jgi:ABC-2 type transport system ATP-binding protein